VNATFPLGWGEADSDFLSKTPTDAAQVIIDKVREMYEKKVAGERPDRVEQMERSIMLQSIDKLWQQHITDMDALREGVRLRAQGQRDPLVEYKREAYEIFETLMNNIQFEILANLFRSTTNLNAFEDFLASLPSSNADEEDSDITDILGNGDLLSMLREQMSQITARARANAPEEDELPAPDMPEGMPGLTEAMDSFGPMELPEGETISGAPMPGVRMKAEKKIKLPRKKVMGKVKRETNPGVLAMGEEELVADPLADSLDAEQK
jgi:preprotein translocase subunit SecA